MKLKKINFQIIIAILNPILNLSRKLARLKIEFSDYYLNPQSYFESFS